jgi:hypothetical protein
VVFGEPHISNQAMAADGTFQLTFSGPDGQPFSVRGTNLLTAPLATWPVLLNGTIPPGGSVTFTDAAAPLNSCQFYRITSP